MGGVRPGLLHAVRLPILLAGLLAVPAEAAVLEIAPTGEVVVYDGPAQIDGTTITPIARPPRARHPEAAAPPISTASYRRAAGSAGLSPSLVEAVAWVESRGNPAARSPKGAVGAMQLMPATAAALRVDPYDREQNLLGGAAYLKAMLDRFDGDLSLALAAYNAGPEAVRLYRGVPPFAETKTYVAAVLRRLSEAAIHRDARP